MAWLKPSSSNTTGYLSLTDIIALTRGLAYVEYIGYERPGRGSYQRHGYGLVTGRDIEYDRGVGSYGGIKYFPVRGLYAEGYGRGGTFRS